MEKTMNMQTSAVGEMARLNHNTIPVFRKYGIDFYCKGKSLLNEACDLSNCDIQNISVDLQTALSVQIDEKLNINSYTLDKLIEHIIDSHHRYVNTTVPEILSLFKTVWESQETNDFDFKRINDLFRQLGNDMKQHMQKEELGLFPFIKKLGTYQQSGEKLPLGTSVKSLITVVEFEHDTSTIITKQINRLCNNYCAPEGSSLLFCTLFNKLREFESDLIMHIHDENNVLHPKAIELEQSLIN